MKANKTTILDLLNGKKQYIVPIFQRIYSWKIDNCKQFFKDIEILIKAEAKNKEHFIGSIVEINHENYSGTLPTYSVIDGQQRLTTSILFILALIDSFKEEIIPEEIKEIYLTNTHRKDNQKYKILLIDEDMKVLKKLINNEKINKSDEDSNIFKNFNFFRDEIIASGNSFDEFINTMGKLTVVLIDLDPNMDNPQLIFESINSTGLSLSQGDLIKNFILIDLSPDEQIDIYEKYWKEIEEKLTKYNQLDMFFKHYLSIKNSKIANEKNIYQEFKKFKNQETKSTIEVIIEIHKYFIIFEKIITNSFEDEKIINSMKNLKSLKNNTPDPFLIELFSKYDNKQIDIDDLEYLINIITSYIIRRAFVGLPTAALNKAFLNLINKLENKNIKEAIIATLLNFENTQKFPSDKDFEQFFKSKNFYNMKYKNTVLQMMENFDNKNTHNYNEYTIEHILPQGENIPKLWKEMLGEDWNNVFDTYVQTIGNITLTRYNSEMSNDPFINKRDMEGGFKETGLRLNTYINKCDQWTKDEIIERANQLYKKSLKVFPRPNLNQEKLDEYKDVKKNKEYTIDKHIDSNNEYIKNLYKNLHKLLENINPNLKLIIKSDYINITKNDDILSSLTFSRDKIKLYFYFWEEITDENKMIRDVSNIGHHANGNAEISITEETFTKCINIIEQVIEKYSD